MKNFGHRMTELQSDRHPRVLSLRVGEIFLCLISIISLIRFARKGINFPERVLNCGGYNLELELDSVKK